MVGEETMKRCFILGNGPSLLSQDLSPLRMETTFACNRFVRWQGAWTPTYYACSANAIIKGVEPAEPPFKESKFLVSRRRDQLASFNGDWVKVYKKESFPPLMSGATELNVMGGATMVGVMAQLAIWLGYEQLYFLGIEQQPGGHVFDPMGSKMPYFIPDEAELFKRWAELKSIYEAVGVRLRDCTPRGRLNEILGYQLLKEVLG